MPINITVVGETSIGVSVTSNSPSVSATGGIGPAGFVTASGTAITAFGVFQLVAGNGITISTSSAQFTVSSYPATAVAGFAPVQSVAGRTGAVQLVASDVTAGTFAIARIPTIGYTALSGVPSTFAPSAHTHSTADVVSFTASASAAAPVQSVQGRAGAVVLTRTDLTAAALTHTHSTADITSFSAAAAAAAPVQSVAGRTGVVQLAAADIISGTFASSLIPTIGYTALSGVPTSFAASAHTHSTTDVVSFAVAAAAAAPVQSVQGRTGTVQLTRADITAAAAAHTHGTADITSFGAAAAAAAPVQSVAGRTGVISLSAADVSGLASVATSGAYTSLSGIPATFTPAIHTHSTSDVVGITAAFAASVHTHGTSDISGYQTFPAQAGKAGPLVTDGTAASWATRYSIVDPVLVQGDGMTLTRNATAGSITIAFAGGTSGIAVSSATPQPLGTASAGSSPDASRADHVHQLPSLVTLSAAASIHTHAASDVTAGTFDVARIPTIGYTALSGVPVTFAPATHTHDASSISAGTLAIGRIPTISYTALSNVPVTFSPTTHTHSTADITGYTFTKLNGLTGTLTIAAGSNVTVSTAGSTITVSASGGGGSGGVSLGLGLALFG